MIILLYWDPQHISSWNEIRLIWAQILQVTVHSIIAQKRQIVSAIRIMKKTNMFSILYIYSNMFCITVQERIIYSSRRKSITAVALA